jgi:hypothetical protein
MKTSGSTVEINAQRSWFGGPLRWQYGSELITTWNVGSNVVFRNEWDGKIFEQKGAVLEFVPESHLKYSLFFPRPGLEDARPIPSDETSDDSGPDILTGLTNVRVSKSLVETKMQ